jgi:hypothetical protein
MGSFTAVLYAFREREYILDLFEAACGARLTYSYITIGGVTHDLPERFLEKLAEFLDYFEPKIDEYNNLLSFNHIFVKRTANVGTWSRRGRDRLRADRAVPAGQRRQDGTCASACPTTSTTGSSSTSRSAWKADRTASPRAWWWATAGTATSSACRR